MALLVLVMAGCATALPRPKEPNDLDTYLAILRNDLDWSSPGLAGARAALDAGDTERACAELLTYYRQRREPRFFFSRDAIPDIAEAIREDMPDVEAELIDNAEHIVARRFPNSTARTVIYRVELPEDFSWTASPTEDPQFKYMLQRSRFWQDLAFGYALTGDERYAETFARQMASWKQASASPARSSPITARISPRKHRVAELARILPMASRSSSSSRTQASACSTCPS